MPASSSQTCCADHQEPESASASYLPSTQEEDTSQNLPTAHVRPSHPLKSFAVPAVPPTGSTYDPALPSTPLLSQQGKYGRVKVEWRGDRWAITWSFGLAFSFFKLPKFPSHHVWSWSPHTSKVATCEKCWSTGNCHSFFEVFGNCNKIKITLEQGCQTHGPRPGSVTH